MAGESPWSQAFGLADRRHGLPNQIATRLSIASATKGFTALTAMSVIESGLQSGDINDYVMPVPVHQLANTKDYPGRPPPGL